jgi:hypothetical protein
LHLSTAVQTYCTQTITVFTHDKLILKKLARMYEMQQFWLLWDQKLFQIILSWIGCSNKIAHSTQKITSKPCNSFPYQALSIAQSERPYCSHFNEVKFLNFKKKSSFELWQILHLISSWSYCVIMKPR